MSSIPSPDLNTILEAARSARVNITLTRYACAIGMTILCYDTLLKFGDEVRLIWGSHWDTTKFLLYFNRILAFFSILLNTWHLAGYRPSLDSTTCEGIIQATAYAQILSLCIANWMLLLRVSALYGHNRIIFWSLTTFWILSYIVTLTMMGITAGDLHGEVRYSPLLDICIIPRIPSTLPAVWVAPIAFEIITFLMSLYKVWSHAREKGDLKSNPLLGVLYRDGILYFVVIMGIRLFNLICWLIFPVTLMFVGVFILWSLIIVMIDRLFLNLRSLHKDKAEKVHWGTGEYENNEAEENTWRTHTPFSYPNGAQSTNIFGGGTMIRDEDINATAGLGVTGVHISRTEERWGKPLYNQCFNLAPMPAKVHAFAHSPPGDSPLNQMQMQIATTPLTYQTQGLSPYDRFSSPQTTAAPRYAIRLPQQHHGSSSRALVNSDNWDETGTYKKSDNRDRTGYFSRKGLGSSDP